MDGIYHVCTMYIPCIYQSGCDIPVIYQAYSLYRLHCLSFVYTLDIQYICIVYLMYIPGICIVYLKYMPGIYSEYTCDMIRIFHVYTMYIHGTYIVYYACIIHPVAGVAEEGRVPFRRIPQQSNRLDES